jgi:hypothetical protein
VVAAVLTSSQMAAVEHSGAHVPAVVHAARLSYLAVGAIGLVGLAACRWLRGGRQEQTAVVEPDRIAA